MSWQLAQKRSLPLEAKIILAQRRIKEWYEHFEGDVDISFSGGFDSTVLLHLVRNMYPEVPAVFVNTGLEFPEILEFVREFENVVWLKPRMTYQQVVDRWGHPVVSKKVSMGVTRYRNTKSEEQRNLRLHGGINPTSHKKQARTIPIKYHHLIDAPFKISDKCCDIMKKEPLKKRYKETGRAPMTGEMAADSTFRKEAYQRTGCNAFDSSVPKSMPLAVWTKADVQEYTERFNLKQSRIYEMGYDRTGCWRCKFGCDMEPLPGRFVLLKKTHPRMHKFMFDKEEEKIICDYLGIPYE